MSELAGLSKHDSVAVITVNNPPVNALSSGVSDAILGALKEAVRDPEVRAVVLIGSGKTFIAGVDIREFGEITAGSRPALNLYPFLLAIEDSPKPVIAAIHGSALGGGLETAMAAHYRVISPGAQVGQPEVKLGLIPGMGGTQRLPRLVGALKAAEMCVWGEPVRAEAAVQLGLGDLLAQGDLLTEAIEFARESGTRSVPKTRNRPVTPADLSGVRSRAREITRFGKAPAAALDAVEAAMTLPFNEGCRYEKQLFEQCLHSTESKALIHGFFGERTVAKVPGLPSSTRAEEISNVAVVGGGNMGSGIAMTFANAGLNVRLKEASLEALERSLRLIRTNYERTVAKGRLSAGEMNDRISRIQGQLDYAGFDSVDLAIEAVFEKLEIKRQVFAELSGVIRPECLLATNTSSLDVDEIASAATRPAQVIGMHFFSPANVMRLLEVVRGARTTQDVAATGMALGKRLGKVAVLASNAPGFIGNRVFAPYLREARFLVEEGATVEQVNDALTEWGMAMGPLAVDDLTGLDVSLDIEDEFARRLGTGKRRSQLLRILRERGRLGQKNGRGWSLYDENRKPQADPEVAGIIDQAARASGIKRRAVAREEVVERCVYGLINEGARVLEEGVALRSVDIDIVFLHGFGFPAWRGGPMFYADTVGLPHVMAHIHEFATRLGADVWQPAPLLERLASSGSSFDRFDREKK